MKLYFSDSSYFDTTKGIDLSIPLSADSDSVRAWYCEPVKIEPVVNGNFIGDVNQGGSVNFRNIFLNPHGNGTHTECVGHISKENFTLNQCLKEFHFKAAVISVQPEKIWNDTFQSDDHVISKMILQAASSKLDLTKLKTCKALIIRTLPNELAKKHHNYSNTNPPYLTRDAIEYILELGIDHLVMDLPSVDREADNGALMAHHLFWNYPSNPQLHKTITEMAYIPGEVEDGVYFLNIQITSLENDASPSKLMLYRIESN
jgi:kynurenine formamidase